MNGILPPIALEIIVLVLGLFLLLAESFSKEGDKSWLARTGIFVLAIVFAWTFFTTGNPPGEPGLGFWNFYSADTIAMFFKRIALLTTIVVLVMGVEYRGVLAKYIPGAAGGAGIGEFYCLPVLTCAGLMFMASAVDFLLIFVSLELVTISFYILVAYMRRSSASMLGLMNARMVCGQNPTRSRVASRSRIGRRIAKTGSTVTVRSLSGSPKKIAR